MYAAHGGDSEAICLSFFKKIIVKLFVALLPTKTGLQSREFLFSKMSKFLVAALMLSLLNHGAGATNTVSAWDDQDFFRYCPPYRCSEDGPEIRFPLRLESSNTSSSCGAACTKLACSGQDTILLHPALGRCNVTAIDYKRAAISIVPLVDSLPACPIQKFISKSIPDVVDHRCASRYDVEEAAILVGCSREFTPSGTSPAEDYVPPINNADYVVGPISCLSNASHFSYLVFNQLYMPVLPLDCKVALNGVIPIILVSTFKQTAERIISFAETTVSWYREGIPNNCTECEMQGRRCAFSPQRNETFCEPRGPHGIFIANWPKSYMIAPPLFPNVVLYF